MRAAISGRPGDARSKGEATLLKINIPNSNSDSDSIDIEDMLEFKDAEIFVGQKYVLEYINDNDNGNSNSMDKIKKEFKKAYSPINYGFKVEKEWEEYRNGKEYGQVDSNEKQYVDALKKYGTTFMIASLVFKNNGYKNDDFTEWSNPKDETLVKDFKEIIDEFVTFCKNKKESSLDSNTFKNNELFKNFSDVLKEGSEKRKAKS